jgi:hypothetical protein
MSKGDTRKICNKNCDKAHIPVTRIGFWKLKNSRYRKYKESANPVWTLLSSGSPLSAMMLPTWREDLYDMADLLWVSIGL